MAAADSDVDERLRRGRRHYVQELGLGRGVVRALTFTTVVAVTAAAAAASWAVYVTREGADRVERFVVFLDDAGEAVRVDLAEDDWRPVEGVWADVAARWVRYLRGRPLDIPTLEYQRRQVIETASKPVYEALREWMKNADRAMGRSAVDVELAAVNVVRSEAGAATVLVRWRERERRNAMIGAWSAMSGTVGLVLVPPEVRTELDRNPTGIYVSDFSFSREN